MEVSFIGRENRSTCTWRKPLTNLITLNWNKFTSPWAVQHNEVQLYLNYPLIVFFTFLPFSLSPNAICVATVLLPTPPFPDNTKITCLTPDKWSDKFTEIIHCTCIYYYIYINIEIIVYLKIDSTSNGFPDTIYWQWYDGQSKTYKMYAFWSKNISQFTSKNCFVLLD